jgi:hypothetical protein
MSIRKKVSIRLAIQAASEDSGGGDSRMRPVMMRWAIAAEEAIGTPVLPEFSERQYQPESLYDC